MENTQMIISGKRFYVGATVDLGGCITNANSIWGSVSEVEKRLGFHPGRLRQGFFVARLTRLPSIDEFNLGGYTNVSMHRFDAAHKLKEEEIKALKPKALRAMSDIGARNLIKIIPVIQHNANMDDDQQYPPGTGVQQWEIKRGSEIPMHVFKFVEGCSTRVPFLRWECL